MAYFDIYNKGPDWIGVDVTPIDGYFWYRVYVRDDYGMVYHDEWYYHTSTVVSLRVEVGGLEPETEYVVNVAHASSQNGSDSTWGSAQYVTTTNASGGGGTGKTVDVYIDFDTNIFYRIRIYWYDRYGEEQGQAFYEPGWVEVQQDTYMEVTAKVMQEGYDDSYPIYCEDDSGRVYEVWDASGERNETFLYVDLWDRTFRFYLDAGGGDEPDYDGSFVKREVYIGGQKYQAYIGGQKYDVYVAE